MGGISHDIEYTHDGTRMIGMLRAPSALRGAPTVLLIHDAFGMTEFMTDAADRLVRLGYSVFLADVWGERALPNDDAEIGPLIGSMVNDRERWHGRVRAALETARGLPEIDPNRIVAMGYCFGGSSALEALRVGENLLGAVSIHGGLDLIGNDWSAARSGAEVLACTGADDPMATAEMRMDLQEGLDAARITWEVDIYSGTKHAFTNPASDDLPENPAVGYHAKSAERAHEATERFLRKIFAPAASGP